MKALVVYYSRSGNTKAVAELIAGTASADLEELVEIGVSRKGLLGYISAGRGGMFKTKSKLQAPSKVPADYDLVFVGSPIWGWNLSPAVRSYLGQTNFGSTPVALFCSMGGSGQEKVFASMRAVAPEANVVGEMAVAMAAIKNPQALQQKVADWVEGFVKMVEPSE
jgi:flavodoxin